MSNNQHKKINYAEDYSATYSDRSLIDKAFALSLSTTISITSIAGVNLSGGRIVYISAGKAYYFDPIDETLAGFILGITKHAALTDDTIDIQLSGVFDEVGLGLIPDRKYFIGVNGSLTTNLSGLKIVQQIGVSLDANKLALNFYSPYITN